MKCLIFKISCCISISSSFIFPYIQSIDIWRHPTTNQLVYGAADRHDLLANDPNNRPCSDALRNSIARGVSSHAYARSIVVEDVLECPYDNSAVQSFKQRMLQQNGRSPLIGLVAYAKEKGLNAVGVEYRFLRAAGIYRGTYGDKKRCEVGVVSGRDMVEEYHEAMACVKNYEDSQLYAYYQQVINSIETPYNKLLMTYFAENDNDIADIFAHMDSVEERDSVVTNFSLFDRRLVDARALHVLANNPLAKNTILFLGACHIAHIKSVLEHELGYVCIKHIGAHYSYPLEPLDKSFDDTRIHEPLLPEELEVLGKSLDEL